MFIVIINFYKFVYVGIKLTKYNVIIYVFSQTEILLITVITPFI